MDIRQIMSAIPHRYPFLLLDRVLEIEAGRRIVAIKNVSFNEPFFQGHFPGVPIMPGVLIIEAMAQAGGVLLLNGRPDIDSKLVFFTGIDRARFRRTVVPGDQLLITMTVVNLRSRNAKMKGVAEVDGRRVAEAEVLSALVDRES